MYYIYITYKNQLQSNLEEKISLKSQLQLRFFVHWFLREIVHIWELADSKIEVQNLDAESHTIKTWRFYTGYTVWRLYSFGTI